MSTESSNGNQNLGEGENKNITLANEQFDKFVELIDNQKDAKAPEKLKKAAQRLDQEDFDLDDDLASNFLDEI